MKKMLIISFLLVFLIVFLVLFDYEFNNTDKVEVTLSKCVDGDTVWLINNDKRKKYRMLGIDTPEVEESLGKESSNYVCNILKESKKIEILYDDVGVTKDKYNRELVWIFVDGELLQTKILEEGYAKVKYIYANYKYLNDLYDSEYNAIRKRIGIWENYKEKESYKYYKVVFNYNNNKNSIKIIENSVLKNIENPYKYGCKFVGWKNGNQLFDLSTEINKDYELTADYEC